MARSIGFSTEETLEKCMHVFWSKGYDATSISELEQSTGLVRASLYNTWGNKEAIFKAVIEYFIRTQCAYWTHILLSQASFKQGVDKLMSTMIKENFDKNYPTGCLITYSAAGMDNHCPEIQTAIRQGHKTILSGIQQGLQQGVEQEEFISDLEVDSISLFILNNFQGLMVLSKTVGNKQNLNQVKQLTLNLLAQYST